jgi:peptidase E
MSDPRRRILALGGGGFQSPELDDPLAPYVASLAASDQPRICLLPTASGDPYEQIVRFYSSFGELGALSHISLFRLGTHPVPVRKRLLAQDVIYVTGGSLLNLLAIWRVHGLDSILREAWEAGVVLCGVSAGSMCWFEVGVTRSHGSSTSAAGLGLLPGSNSVHYGSDAGRRRCFHDAIAHGAPAGYGVEDGVGLLFEGTRLKEAVSAREHARAYRVELLDDDVGETPIEPRRLTGRPGANGREPIEIAEFREAKRRRDAAGNRSRSAYP